MTTALHTTTRVLPGKRLEIAVPQLEEGEEVDIFVMSRLGGREGTPPVYQNALDFLDALPPSTRSPEDWARIERELQEEKDAWGD